MEEKCLPQGLRNDNVATLEPVPKIVSKCIYSVQMPLL